MQWIFSLLYQIKLFFVVPDFRVFSLIIMRLTALLNIRYAPRDFKVYHSGLGKYTTGIQVSINVVRILNILLQTTAICRRDTSRG